MFRYNIEAMKNGADNKVLDHKNLEERSKLTDVQLFQIRKMLPKNFAILIAETYEGINSRQVKEVFNQRSRNVEWNRIVWNAINKKLTENNREDLIEAVSKRLSFCESLLVI